MEQEVLGGMVEPNSLRSIWIHEERRQRCTQASNLWFARRGVASPCSHITHAMSIQLVSLDSHIQIHAPSSHRAPSYLERWASMIQLSIPFNLRKGSFKDNLIVFIIAKVFACTWYPLAILPSELMMWSIFDSSGVYSDGDFMVHLAGIDDKRKWVANFLEEMSSV